MDFKAEKVAQIVQTYNVPQAAAELCVDLLGGVDQAKLNIAVSTMEAIKDGLTARNQAEVETLRGHLKECQDQAKLPGANTQALAMQCITIKRRIYEMGGRP